MVAVPGSRRVGRPGCPSASRHGVWGLLARCALGFVSGFAADWKGRERTACPRERGLMSRNARTLSDSKSLKEGISPVH
jgi:hypothetical protein